MGLTVQAPRRAGRVSKSNAWQWAEEDKAKRFQLHEVSYRNFKRGEFKYKEAQGKLDKLNKAKAPGKDCIDDEV